MWQDSKLLNAVANALFSLVIFAGLVSGVWWVIHRPVFTLSALKVEAKSGRELRHVNALTIRDQAVSKIKGNFFTANLDDVRAAFEQVPWVRKASVQRVWPDRLQVTLEEHQVLGTWGEDGKLISVDGEVFTANLAEAEEDTELLSFSGPDGSEQIVLKQYGEFKEWFSVLALSPNLVQYSARSAWSLRLNNGLYVELGKAQDSNGLKTRVEQLIKVYPQLLARLKDNIVSVDMRYPNGLALKSSRSELSVEIKSKAVRSEKQ